MNIRNVRLALCAVLALASVRAAAQARVHHASAMLPDGRVLITGGEDIDRLYEFGAGTRLALLRSSAIFDPSTDSWSRTGPLASPRTGHSAVALPDGRVVVLGGGSSPYRLDERVEIWTAGRFRRAGALITARVGHTATLLGDGRVLIAGGRDASGAPIANVEIYDPASRSSTAAAALPVPVAEHTATRLADGRVLIAGGGTARAFVWDGRWIEARPMSGARARHSAALLRDGRVLIVGNREGHRQTGCGARDPASCLREPVLGDVAEIFDPRTLSFTRAAPTRQPRLDHHRAIALADGRVAVLGIFEPDRGIPRVVEIWDPATGAWEDWGDAALAGPEGMSATLLRDGRVLLVGAQMEPNAQGRVRAARSFETWRPMNRRSPRGSVVRRAVLHAG